MTAVVDRGRCVSCGASGGRVVVRSGPWRVVRCDGCGLERTAPRPTAAELTAAYDADYYAERSMTREDPAAWRARAREVLAGLETATTGGRVGSVLDVGAGTGGLVRALVEGGTDAVGVEPSAAARSAAASVGGPALRAALPEAGGFDGAVLLHVLEHVEDPVGTLVAVRDRLRPGGALLVEVPHRRSADALAPAVRRALLDLPVHLHHFSPTTLADVARRAGFEVVEVRRFNATAVERLLALRARGDRGGGEERTPADDRGPVPAPTPTPSDDPGPGPGRSLWRAGLELLRRVAPGPKLVLIARSAPRDAPAPV